jgi:hypothetical protein
MKGELVKYLGKNREDAFDIIALRAKELKILYGLLCVLLFTLAYEYGGVMLKEVMSETAEEAVVTGVSAKRYRLGDFRNLAKGLEGFQGEFPQFATRLNREKAQLDKIIANYSKTDGKTLMQEGEIALRGLYSFVTHPAIEKNKLSKTFKTSVVRVAKTGGITFSTKLEITPLLFDKKVANSTDGQRNIFEYDESI